MQLDLGGDPGFVLPTFRAGVEKKLPR